MDKTTLVEKDFEAGKLLIQKLDEAHINVHSAFWLYNSEEDIWRLIIASKITDFSSPRKAYSHVNNVLKKLKREGSLSGINLENISVISPNHPLIKILGQAVTTGADTIENIRFTRNTIGNNFIEDAYIYRIQ